MPDDLKDGWAPISTAPRNGLSIVVSHPDCGSFIMHWNPTGENWLGGPGMGQWEAPDGSFTWSERRGDGPDRWKYLEGVGQSDTPPADGSAPDA